MCIHYHKGLHACGCLKILPCGGPGYKPPSLCEGVKYAYSLYHTQPERPPQQFSLPPPQACPPIEANEQRPGNVVILAIPEVCPLHLGIEALDKVSLQHTVDEYMKHLQTNHNQAGTLFPIHQWREIFGSPDAIGELEGEDGTFREVERYQEATKTGAELAKDYAEMINMSGNTSSDALENTDLPIRALGKHRPRPIHNIAHHQAILGREKSGFPSASQLNAIAKDFEYLSINRDPGQQFVPLAPWPVIYSNNTALHNKPITPPQLTKGARTPGAPRKTRRGGRGSSKKSNKLQEPSANHQRSSTPTPTGRGPRSKNIYPEPFERKNNQVVAVRVSLALEEPKAPELPTTPAIYPGLRFRPRSGSELQAAESGHRRTRSY